MLLTWSREAPGSNLNPKHWVFWLKILRFSTLCPRWMTGSALNYIVTSLLFSHPFLFIIHCPRVIWRCAVWVTGNIIKFNHKQTSFSSHSYYPEVRFSEVHSIYMTFRSLLHCSLQVNVFIMIIFYIYSTCDNNQDQIQNSLNTVCLCMSIDH
jgi:hypothetical protein